MTIIGSFPINQINGKDEFFVLKNHQNSLKGLIWGAVGASLTVGTLALTAFTIVAVAATIFSVGPLHTYVPELVTRSLPLLGTGVTATVLTDYLAVKGTGGCFSNAVYHLGPEYQIVKA